MDPFPYPLSNIYVRGGLILLVLLVTCVYVVIYWRSRAARKRRSWQEEDSLESLHYSPPNAIWTVNDAPTHSVDPGFEDGGGHFGGAGASDGYDSGGGSDSGDGGDGGDGGGGDGD